MRYEIRMHIQKTFRVHPDGYGRCVKCDTRMIVVDGFGLEPECKTFECLQCRHIEKPQTEVRKTG